MSGALPDPGFIVILAGGLVAVFALNEARHHLHQRWRARHTRTSVPGITGTPPSGRTTPPLRPSPAPGPCKTTPCGCAARAQDILDLLLWADELKDRLTAICTCGGTGWITTTALDGTLTEQACRDCLGPGGDR